MTGPQHCGLPPVCRLSRTLTCALTVQPVEQPPCKRQVRGSSPLSGLEKCLVNGGFLAQPSSALNVQVVRLRTMGGHAGTTRTMGDAIGARP